jgi:HlyD family secretion protein
MRKLIFSVFIIMTALALAGCFKGSKDKVKQKEKIITVQSLPTYSDLYFSGTLHPHKQIDVTSPVDGVISNMGFAFGQKVTKGQSLFKLKASKGKSNFETALAGYLKAKESLNSDQGKLQSTKSLFKKGLVSKDELDQDSNSYNLSQLSLLQAQNQLKTALLHYNIPVDVFNLSISDIRSINKALKNTKGANQIAISSPIAGVALFPSGKSSSGSSSKEGKASVGSQVKVGQVLVSVGQLDALAMKGTVNEVDVNQIRKGMKATVTSVAFPKITLNGVISEIDSQATSSGNLPVFSLIIVIPKLPKGSLDTIKVGMSAKAEVKIKHPPQIRIPIAAVTQNAKTGQSLVTQMVKGKKVQTPIVTGRTSLTSVTVESGLKAGDKIVVSH